MACVVPSAIWRSAVGLGADFGWSQGQVDAQQIPGGGTRYVIVLSLTTLGAAGLTFALVRPWGERFPAWVPGLRRRSIPATPVALVAVVGAVAVMVICLLSIVNWDQVSGFADQPDSGWAVVMALCYLPAVLWGPLLMAVTVDYWRRRRA